MPDLIAVMGPTGSGKSDLAQQMAVETGALLISADAFQVYRGFDIGTNKPPEGQRIALMDICEPSEGFGVGEFIRLCLPLLAAAFEQDRDVIVVGGTGFYIRALFEEYAEMHGSPDPTLREELGQATFERNLSRLLALEPDTKIDIQNPVRVSRRIEKLLTPSQELKFHLPGFQKLKFGLLPDRDWLTKRIEQRLDQMLERGWEGELRLILESGVQSSAPAMRAIGYETLSRLIQGKIDRAAARDEILILTRQYAKRQVSWMKTEPGLRPIHGGIELAMKAFREQMASRGG